MPRATWLGLVAGLLIVIGSFGAGATRNRGGVMPELGLDHLTFGHGRSIMDTTLTCGILALVLAWVWLGRTLAQQSISPAVMKRVTWLWILPFSCAAPILSRDVYSYLMQGAMLRDGFDPYTEGAAVNPGPFLLEVSHDWRNTTTPYGPLHLWIGERVTSLVGDNVSLGLVAYKVLTLAGFATIVWAVPKIAERIGGNPALALWLGVANPVMLLHLVGGMHNETIMVGLVSLGLVACLSQRFVLGTALIALSVSLKATAAIALPFVVWLAYHHYATKGGARLHNFGKFVGIGAASMVITGAVLSAVTWVSGSSWGWVAEISGNSKVVNPLAGPTLAADVITPFVQLFNEHFHYNTALSLTRSAGTMLMLIGLVVTWLIFRRDARETIMGITVAYAVAFVTNAVTFPWYYASLITLAGTFNPPAWLRKILIGGSVLVALAFTGSGNHRFYDGWFCFVIAALAWAAVEVTKKPSPARA